MPNDSSESVRSHIQKLTKKLMMDIAQIDGMIALTNFKIVLQTKIAEKNQQISLLLQRGRGGSKKGRKIIMRNFEQAFDQVVKHYFAPRPLYNASLFRRRFRVSRSVFDKVYETCLKHPTFHHRQNAAGRWGIHPLVKVTAVFRQLAYGSCSDELDEHFQISETSMDEAKEAFCDVVIENFEHCYLPPMSTMLARRIIQQNEQFGWPGLLGSLDCSHWEWTRCPKSLHGEFKKGTHKHPSIVYECLCDCNLRILHVSFAAPGSNNDINVLDLSPFLYDLVSGKTIAPFTLDGVQYHQPYVLVDGIYPEWSCFVKPLTNVDTESERNYTMRQEARRKDIERAFGCLMIKWNILRLPSLTPNVVLMEKVLRVCCILHNMIVEEKIEENEQGDEYSVSDAVFNDTMECDQVGVAESEIEPADECTLNSVKTYFNYLKSADGHRELRQRISNHLWEQKQIEAIKRYKNVMCDLVEQ